MLKSWCLLSLKHCQMPPWISRVLWRFFLCVPWNVARVVKARSRLCFESEMCHMREKIEKTQNSSSITSRLTLKFPYSASLSSALCRTRHVHVLSYFYCALHVQRQIWNGKLALNCVCSMSHNFTPCSVLCTMSSQYWIDFSLATSQLC